MQIRGGKWGGFGHRKVRFAFRDKKVKYIISHKKREISKYY